MFGEVGLVWAGEVGLVCPGEVGLVSPGEMGLVSPGEVGLVWALVVDLLDVVLLARVVELLGVVVGNP